MKLVFVGTSLASVIFSSCTSTPANFLTSLSGISEQGAKLQQIGFDETSHETSHALSPKSEFEAVLAGLQPQTGNAGLLISFDTDTGQNSQGYDQFYDFTQPAQAVNTNKTLYLTRVDDTIHLAAELEYIASPQTERFIYAGQVRYLEAPRTEDCFAMPCIVGFDYSRIWTADSKLAIQAAKDEAIAQIKDSVDADFAARGADAQNVTDYEKVSFITDGFYVTEGFWSQTTGGAAWFQAYEKSSVVALSNREIPTHLRELYSPEQIASGFQPVRDMFGDRRWLGEVIDYVNNSLYTLARVRGNTHVLGLIEVDGNAHRRFHASANMGIAPESIIAYDNPPLDFDQFQNLYPAMIDLFVSPNENTVFVLTDEAIVGIDVFSKQEIFRENHNLSFNKVVMVEWATGRFVTRWQQELTQ
ncbi:MAG: hypothetical protein AAGE59_18000 [Cyanobacteria bacterium P01_F01_bin.86]